MANLISCTKHAINYMRELEEEDVTVLSLNVDLDYSGNEPVAKFSIFCRMDEWFWTWAEQYHHETVHGRTGRDYEDVPFLDGKIWAIHPQRRRAEYMSEYIHPCSGCSDYEEPNGCKSKGGCGKTEYITRSSAIQAVGDIHPLDYNGQGIVERIKAIPAADVVEVRHGRWREAMGASGVVRMACTNCGFHRFPENDVREPMFNYCPRCGAKMDGGQDDD